MELFSCRYCGRDTLPNDPCSECGDEGPHRPKVSSSPATPETQEKDAKKFRVFATIAVLIVLACVAKVGGFIPDGKVSENWELGYTAGHTLANGSYLAGDHRLSEEELDVTARRLSSRLTFDPAKGTRNDWNNGFVAGFESGWKQAKSAR